MTDITNYIANDFRAIDSRETIASVQDFFTDLNFSHFPVLEDGVYIGNITADDIETFDSQKKVIDYKYTLEHFFARKNMIWLDVLEVFAKNHTNLIPVLDENNTYLGFYEMNCLIRFFHETPFLKEQGGVIIVKKGILDYSMSEIARIVESNNGKILGIFVSDINADSVQITMKISLGAMNSIIQTFRRYNYEIISEHQEDAYIDNLRKRSDYLDKYLNI